MRLQIDWDDESSLTIGAGLLLGDHSMKYDPLEKRTRIPLRVMRGELAHFYDGTPIKDLREGTIGEIVVNNYQIKDEARLLQYNSESSVLFLSKGTMLIARVSLRSVPDDLRESLGKQGKLIDGGQVELFLEEDLSLFLRGTKDAKLEPCVCRIPALEGKLGENEQAISVNHAYTIRSSFFEPHRQAKGGNVFNCMFYCSEPHNVWQH